MSKKPRVIEVETSLLVTEAAAETAEKIIEAVIEKRQRLGKKLEMEDLKMMWCEFIGETIMQFSGAFVSSEFGSEDHRKLAKNFFLESAPNIVSYIDTIQYRKKPAEGKLN